MEEGRELGFYFLNQEVGDAESRMDLKKQTTPLSGAGCSHCVRPGVLLPENGFLWTENKQCAYVSGHKRLDFG